MYLDHIDKKRIRLLAFDLDGTLLNNDSHVSPKTRDALERAAAAGYTVTIATGRVFTSLPSDIAEIPAIKYAVSSNGAHTIDMSTGKTIYESLIPRQAVLDIMPILMAKTAMTEVFFEHNAYISRYCAEHLEEFGVVTEKRRNYMLSTRKPVEDLEALIYEHIDEFENLKLNYADYDEQLRVNEKLQKHKDLTVVCYQHLGFGIEIGGGTTSKASALGHLCSQLGLTAENAMVFGDSANDMPMVAFGGVGVAMGNAVDALKNIADVVCPSNEEDGIAAVIDELLSE